MVVICIIVYYFVKETPFHHQSSVDSSDSNFNLSKVSRDATGIPEIQNSDRILGILYNPNQKSDKKLNPEHRHIMC